MKRTTRATLSVLAAGAAITALALTGCSSAGSASNSSNSSGSSNSSKSAPTLAPNKKVTITFAEAMSSGSLKTELDKLTQQFEQKNPNITVTLQPQPDYGTLKTKVDAAVTAGSPPTISQVYGNWAAAYAQSDVLEPLTAYAAADPSAAEGLYKGIKNSLYIGKTMYMWPFNASTVVTFYNPDMLKAAGQSVPTTWTQFAAVAKAVSKNGVVALPIDPGSSSGPAGGTTIFELIAQADGTPVFKNDGTPQFDSPAAVKALDYLVDLKKAGAVQTGTNYPGETALGAQKGAFDISTSTSFYYDQQAVGGKFQVAVAPVPGAEDGTRVNQINGTNIAMFSNASDDQKAAAWKYMQFLTDAETQSAWAQATGYLPVNPKTLDLADMKDYIAKNPYVTFASKDLADSSAEPPYAWVDEAEGDLAAALQSALAGNATPTAALKDAQDKAEKVMASDQ
ncbi:ABC transporter substrate-binding protein [Gryllotalpicola reticulitermitis]|uniref:ABC transporter substrate-binding protein n=1 Tax=Gryllotalpicola reticulitermitis TaxID=1184153 RepID=A0ABV8QAD2_9MICO